MITPIHKMQGLVSLASSGAHNFEQFTKTLEDIKNDTNSTTYSINSGSVTNAVLALYDSQVVTQKLTGTCVDDNFLCLVVYKYNSRTESNDPDVYARQLIDDYKSNTETNLYNGRILYLFIYDLGKREGFLRADNYGVTRLYYAVEKDTLFFGNTAQGIQSAAGLKKQLDHQSIYNYLYFHVLPTPLSIFQNIATLEPGECLRIKGQNFKKERYWRVSYKSAGSPHPDELHKAFYNAVSDNVKSIENTGAFLSGGLDSSCVSGLYRDYAKTKIPTFSIGFGEDGYDEIAYAQIAADHFDTNMHTYYVTPKDILEVIPLIIRAYSEPFGNSSAVPTYYCAKLAKQAGMSSLLAGDGGDELFGGNERYKKLLILSQFDRLPAGLKNILTYMLGGDVYGKIPVLKKLSSYIKQANLKMPKRMESYNLLSRVGNNNIFNDDFIRNIDLDSPDQYMQHEYNNVEAESILNKMLGYDLKLTLADNDLPKVVNMCELSGIDVSFPYFEQELFDLSTRLPDSQKTTMRMLRVYFRNTMRNYLPAEILSKKKHGFGLPVALDYE